eukprot:m.184685 g.184685  ORF g.184685 m.184685 type:complete len:472 (+) comp16193_c0_seq1:113-1528(+)
MRLPGWVLYTVPILCLASHSVALKAKLKVAKPPPLKVLPKLPDVHEAALARLHRPGAFRQISYGAVCQASGGNGDSYFYCNGMHYCCGREPGGGCSGAYACTTPSSVNLNACACVPGSANDPALTLNKTGDNATDPLTMSAYPGLYEDCLPMASPCNAVNLADVNEAACLEYLDMPFVKPECRNSSVDQRVPRVYHAMAGSDEPPPEVQKNLREFGQGYRLNYHNDLTGLQYVLRRCGREVAEAFRCFIAPAYRADIFRFCALYADGGVYLDADLELMVPLDDTHSPCSHVTIGHDYPQSSETETRKPGVQMKILAARAGSPLMGCMLDRIVDNVRRRWTPGPNDNALSLTGPALLSECLQLCVSMGKCTREGVQPLSHAFQGMPAEWVVEQQPNVVREPAKPTSIAITYRDSRQAAFPHAGMVGTDANNREVLLAYEVPRPLDFGYSSTTHYSKLAAEGRFYRDDCSLHS